MKNIIKLVLILSVIFVTNCYAKDVELDTKDIKELSISCVAKEVGSQLIFKETTNSKLKIEYNEEFYSLETKLEKNKIALNIKHLKMATSYPFDFVTIYVPTDKYSKFSIYVETTGLSFKDIKSINCNFDITANASSASFNFPVDFNNDIKLTSLNGSNCLLDFATDKLTNFKLDLKSNSKSHITFPKEWNYNKLSSEFEYGNGKSIIDINVQDSYFKLFLNEE